MIIDSHAHLDENETYGWHDTPSKLLGLMDDAGIDRAVVTTYADDPGPGAGIDQLKEYVDAHPDRFIGFPRIDPRYGEEAIDLFERAITEYGMAGLKLHPVSNLSSPYASFTVELLERAAAFDVPVLIHSGDRVMCLPHQIGEAASRTDATILMGHVGGFHHPWEALEVAKTHENIVLESSAFPYPRVLQAAVDELGADRVIYGSDQPAANPQVELEKIAVLDLTDSQRKRILAENTAELLGMEAQ